MSRYAFATVILSFALWSCGDRLSSISDEIAADAALIDAGVGGDSICPENQDCGPPPAPEPECATCCPQTSCPPVVRACATLGCAFAPWGWCGPSDTVCDGTGQFAADPTSQQCERQAVATCVGIGFPIAECYITFAQSCSAADTAAAYQHCIRSRHLPNGSACQLVWR